MEVTSGRVGHKQSNEYDVCVVGAGTIGSAAARHLLKLHPEARVLLIGPSEKADRRSTDIHGAYYDESRLTRTVDPSPLWSELARRSLRNYRAIERTAGIKFYHEVGFLGIGPSSHEYIMGLKKAAQKQNCAFKELSNEELRQTYPYIDVSPHSRGLLVQRDSGYINPRDMVAALQSCAEKIGCDVIDDVVKRIIPPRSEAHEYNALISDSGRLFYARKVLLATGAFTECRNLLPPAVQPDLTLQAEACAVVEVPRRRVEKFVAMPSVIHVKDENHEQAYIVPPIKYPDGKYYLKIGHGKVDPEPIGDGESIKRWYWRNQHGYIEDYLLRSLHQYFPELDTSRVRFDYAITAHTPSGFPYIDMVTSSVGVVIAGNGRGAKAADELGHMAARMILSGNWDSDLPQEQFKLQMKKALVVAKL